MRPLAPLSLNPEKTFHSNRSRRNWGCDFPPLIYHIEFRPAASRDLAKLERVIAKKVIDDIEKLAKNPRPHGVEKLEGGEKLYRIRVGPGKNFRAIYPDF